MSSPLAIKIEKVVYGGDGISFVDGKVCFVPGALPGEAVLAAPVTHQKNLIRARLLQVKAPSPDRVDSPCPYVARCGGCQYQHVSYEKELVLKQTQVLEILNGVPGFQAGRLCSIVASPKHYRYRNGVTLHLKNARGRKPEIPGFVGRDNVSTVTVSDCLLADERLKAVFSAPVRPAKKSRSLDGTCRVEYKLTENGRVASGLKEQFIRVRVGGVPLLAAAGGFFQNNLGVTDLLASRVREWVRRVKPDIFFDLFAGVGTFSMLCAAEVSKFICVEENRSSLEALRMNRHERGFENMEILPGRVEDVFPRSLGRSLPGKTLCLLDPPRQGLAPRLSGFLSRQADITAIVYISCDPTTLARDLKIILSGGLYHVEEVVPFDMFPRTKHIETACLLTKGPGP